MRTLRTLPGLRPLAAATAVTGLLAAASAGAQPRERVDSTIPSLQSTQRGERTLGTAAQREAGEARFREALQRQAEIDALFNPHRAAWGGMTMPIYPTVLPPHGVAPGWPPSGGVPPRPHPVPLPAYGSPGHEHPGHGSPGYGSPGYGSPGYGSPGYGPPGYGSPGYGSPGHGLPGYGSPGYGAPGHAPPGHAPHPGYGPPPGARVPLPCQPGTCPPPKPSPASSYGSVHGLPTPGRHAPVPR